MRVCKSIEEINLTVRSYTVLKRYGINSLDQLANMSESELNKVRNLGKASLQNIKEVLAEEGLELRKE